MDWREQTVRARYLVAALGEVANPPWWRSQAMGSVGRQMLQLLFPRTAISAALETASRAASLQHDQHIGVVGAYHLFRLRTQDEIALREYLSDQAGQQLLAELAARDEPDVWLAALTEISGSVSAGKGGPTHCGFAHQTHDTKILKTIAAAYLDGFKAGRPVYPYLLETAV